MLYLCFRPLMGIILFNRSGGIRLCVIVEFIGFRPLMGIILFNS